MAFSNTLRRLLDEKKMKAVDLSRLTGLSEAAISDYLSGKKEPRGKQSIAISQALNVSLDTLWETDFETTKIEASPLNLSEDASKRLEKLVTLIDKMSNEEWNKLLDYATLLLSAQQIPRDAKLSTQEIAKQKST